MDDSNLKTLSQIWESNDRRPVTVFNDASNDKCELVGITGLNAIVMGINKNSLGFRDSELKKWRSWKEPKQPKLLWPAILYYEDENYFTLSETLFDSFDEAKRIFEIAGSVNVIRLATAKDFAEGFLIEEEG